MPKEEKTDAAIRSRRKFLIGGAAGLTALATGAVIWDQQSEGEQPDKTKPQPRELKTLTATHAGDMTRDINQAEINLLYRDIYSKIKAAKDGNNTGKPLAIIIGEDHTGTHSLITQLMILSAAKKLGVSTYASEDPPEGVTKFEAQLSPLMPKQRNAIDIIEGEINPHRDPRKTGASQVISDAFLVLSTVKNKVKGQVWIPTFAATSAFLKGFDLIGMDPKHNQIDSAIREPAMLEVLGNQKSDYVVATGFAHAANMAKGLKEKGQAVLLLDVLNKNIDTSNADLDTRKRFEDFDKNADMKIVINGRPPATINELFAHAAIAEISFDYANEPGFIALASSSLRANLDIQPQQRGR